MKTNVSRLSGIVLVLAGWVVAQSSPKHEPVIPNLPASPTFSVSTTRPMETKTHTALPSFLGILSQAGR